MELEKSGHWEYSEESFEVKSPNGECRALKKNLRCFQAKAKKTGQSASKLSKKGFSLKKLYRFLISFFYKLNVFK